MKKTGGAMFTGTYIMYGLLVIAVILLVVFIVRGSIMERFFEATTTDSIQAKLNRINTQSGQVTDKDARSDLCTKELPTLLTDTKKAIDDYISNHKTIHDQYAARFNSLSQTVKNNCNRSYPVTVPDILLQIPPAPPAPPAPAPA